MHFLARAASGWIGCVDTILSLKICVKSLIDTSPADISADFAAYLFHRKHMPLLRSVADLQYDPPMICLKACARLRCQGGLLPPVRRGLAWRKKEYGYSKQLSKLELSGAYLTFSFSGILCIPSRPDRCNQTGPTFLCAPRLQPRLPCSAFQEPCPCWTTDRGCGACAWPHMYSV